MNEEEIFAEFGFLNINIIKTYITKGYDEYYIETSNNIFLGRVHATDQGIFAHPNKTYSTKVNSIITGIYHILNY